VVVRNRIELKLPLRFTAVPAYRPGTDRNTSDIIADLTPSLLFSWKYSESIVNMIFDTTLDI